jgi:hypothetical protein
VENFNKRGQLISTLTGTFYEAIAAEEEDWRRRRGRGDNVEDGAVDVRSHPFRLMHAIKTCASDVRKKATLGGNQRRHILKGCVSSTKLSVTDFMARYQYGNDQ